MSSVVNPFTGRWIMEPKIQNVWGNQHATWFTFMGIGGALFINRMFLGIERGRFWGMTWADILSLDYQYPKTTLGDVNGDGMEDIIVYYLGPRGYSVDVILDGRVQVLAEGVSLGQPARVALIRFSIDPE